MKIMSYLPKIMVKFGQMESGAEPGTKEGQDAV